MVQTSPNLKRMHIYALSESDTGEIRYIGKTTAELHQRLAGHLSRGYLKKNTYKNCWIRGVLARGANLLIHSVQVLSTEDDLNAAEIYWIKFFRDQGYRLTNGTDGGDGLRNPSAETRAKTSAAIKAVWEIPGHKERMSLAHKDQIGHPMSQKTKEAVSACQKGKVLSDDTKRKISSSKKGKKQSKEHIANAEAARKRKREQKLADPAIVMRITLTGV